MNRIQYLFPVAALIIALNNGCVSEPQFVEYPYHQPLSSPGQKFAGLPPAVQATVRAQVGAAQMENITKLTESGQVVYRISFQDRERFPALYVAPDGSVLYPESFGVAVGAGQEDIGAISGGGSSGLKLSDLPPPAVKKIQEAAPSGEVAFIQKFNLGGLTYYDVTFKNGTHHPVRVSEEGMLLK